MLRALFIQPLVELALVEARVHRRVPWERRVSFDRAALLANPLPAESHVYRASSLASSSDAEGEADFMIKTAVEGRPETDGRRL